MHLMSLICDPDHVPRTTGRLQRCCRSLIAGSRVVDADEIGVSRQQFAYDGTISIAVVATLAGGQRLKMRILAGQNLNEGEEPLGVIAQGHGAQDNSDLATRPGQEPPHQSGGRPACRGIVDADIPRVLRRWSVRNQRYDMDVAGDHLVDGDADCRVIQRNERDAVVHRRQCAQRCR